MAVHDNFADLAVRLIEKNGRPVTVRRATITRDPAEPWKIGSSTDLDTSSTGVFFENAFSDLEIALAQAIGAPEGSRTSVARKSTECWIPAKGLAFAIEPKDTLIDDATTWEITDVRLIGPGPTPVVYICTLGR